MPVFGNKGQVTVLSSQGEARRSFKVKDAGLLNGIAFSKSGDIIVSDHESGTITIYTAAGEFVRQFREKSKEGHLLSGPDGLAVSKEGLVFVVERWSHCVSVFTEEGTFLYRFGDWGEAEGEFYYPNYILITPDDPKLHQTHPCLLYTSPSPRDRQKSRMPSSA